MLIYIFIYIYIHTHTPEVENSIFLNDIFNLLTTFTKFVSPTSFFIVFL